MFDIDAADTPAVRNAIRHFEERGMGPVEAKPATPRTLTRDETLKTLGSMFGFLDPEDEPYGVEDLAYALQEGCDASNATFTWADFQWALGRLVESGHITYVPGGSTRRWRRSGPSSTR